MIAFVVVINAISYLPVVYRYMGMGARAKRNIGEEKRKKGREMLDKMLFDRFIFKMLKKNMVFFPSNFIEDEGLFS